MSTKIEPRFDQEESRPSNNGFLKLSNALIAKMIDSKVEPALAWTYVVLLYSANYTSCTPSVNRPGHGEVQITDRELVQRANLKPDVLRKIKYHFRKWGLVISRKVGKSHILRLPHYDQHTLSSKIPDKHASQSSNLNW